MLRKRYSWATSRKRRHWSRSAATASCSRRSTRCSKRGIAAGVRDEPRHGRLPDERMADRPARRADRARPRRSASLRWKWSRRPSAAKASPTPRSTKCRCCAKRARRPRSKCWSTAASRCPNWPATACWWRRPAGSTAYNLSARGPILPLQAKMLALTPISPFRPRRWSGAILPDDTAVCFRVLEPENRPGFRRRRPVRGARCRQGRSPPRPRAFADLVVRSRACARRADRDGAIRDLNGLLFAGKLRYLAASPSRGCSPVAQR